MSPSSTSYLSLLLSHPPLSLSLYFPPSLVTQMLLEAAQRSRLTVVLDVEARHLRILPRSAFRDPERLGMESSMWSKISVTSRRRRHDQNHWTLPNSSVQIIESYCAALGGARGHSLAPRGATLIQMFHKFVGGGARMILSKFLSDVFHFWRVVKFHG